MFGLYVLWTLFAVPTTRAQDCEPTRPSQDADGDGVADACDRWFSTVLEEVPFVGLCLDLVVVDSDEDGDEDVIALVQDAAAYKTYRNDGGTFVPADQVGAPGGPWYLGEGGDFDGDGHVDLLLAGATLKLALGHGDGTFDTPVLIDSHDVAPPIWFSSQDLAVADLDADGASDIVLGWAYEDPSSPTATQRNGIKRYRNRGDGTFEPAVLVVEDAREFVLGDVDDDGDLDIVYTPLWPGRLQWAENVAGVFTSGNPPPFPAFMRHEFAFLDADQDGDDDVVGDQEGLRYYERSTGTSFQEITGRIPTQETMEASELAVARFDGNDAPDLFARVSGTGLIAVYNGAPTWTVEPVHLDNNPSLATRVADFDGDGLDDVVNCHWGKSIVWHRNPGASGSTGTGTGTTGTSGPSDTGPADTGGRIVLHGGCGCASGGPMSPVPWALLLVGFGVRSRRRQAPVRPPKNTIMPYRFGCRSCAAA